MWECAILPNKYRSDLSKYIHIWASLVEFIKRFSNIVVCVRV